MLSKRLILNSKDRNPILSKSSTDFVVSLNDTALQSVKQITVESVSVSNLQYNVNEYNNAIRWTETGGTVDSGLLELAVGQYDIDEFVLLLTTLLNSTGNGDFEVAHELPKYKLKITNTTVDFKFIPSSCFDLIGLELDLSESKVSGSDNVLYASYTPDLGGANKLYVHSKALAEYDTITSAVGSASILTYVSFHDTAFGNNSTRFINDPDLESISYSTRRPLNSIDVKIRDVSGNIVDLQNSDIVLVLKVYY